MPKLNGKSYAYTKKGKEAYKEALVTQGVVAGGKKIYNKVVDKVNKKRGY